MSSKLSKENGFDYPKTEHIYCNKNFVGYYKYIGYMGKCCVYLCFESGHIEKGIFRGPLVDFSRYRVANDYFQCIKGVPDLRVNKKRNSLGYNLSWGSFTILRNAKSDVDFQL